MSKNFRISGTGCTLVDYLYKPVDFNSQQFHPYISKNPGDGGLAPGKLVFSEEFQKFTGKDYLKTRDEITGNMPPVAVNIGGPSVVSLIHAAQLTHHLPVEVRFYASRGADEGGKFIEEMLPRTPLKKGLFKIGSQYTPFTDVLSDPSYDEGNGERIFINNIGAAREMMPSDLDETFFTSDITVFGGTALVPNIHQLSPDDRLIVQIQSAIQHKLPFNLILQALNAAIQFRAKDENGKMLPADLQFVEIYNLGLTEVFKTVCGFDYKFISSIKYMI